MAETKGNILKVRLGNDTRRQLLYNASISYNDLVLMLQRIFGGKLQPTDDVTLKYFDEDDDLITIIDDEDFAHAREYSQTGVVKMVIYLNGKDARTCIDGGTVTGIRKELSQVRDKVNSMIDCLSGTQLSGLELDSAFEESTQKTSEVAQAIEATKPVSSATISIFDPYTTPPATTTVASLPATESTSTVTPQPVISSSTTGESPMNVPSSSSSTTSHLFQGGSESSGFLDQSNQSSVHVSSHRTGQMGVPQTGQHPPQSNPPTAPPNSSSPKPPQASQTGYSAGYPPGQSAGYQTGSSYATGQVNFPTSQSQSGYQTGQSGYTGSQTGQGAYQTGYTSAYGSSYPPQSSAPTPPSSSSTQYPPSTTPTPGQYQPGPPYNPAVYGQPPSQYAPGQNPPPGSYPMPGGAGRGSRVTAYGQAPYKVGY